MSRALLDNYPLTTALSLMLALITGTLPLPADAGLVQVFDVDAGSPKVERVTDLCPGPCNGVGSNPLVYDNKLMFVGAEQNGSGKLWALDSSNNLTLVNDSNPGGGDKIGKLVEADGDMYFFSFAPDTGREIWRYDGSSASLAHELVEGQADTRAKLLIGYQNDLMFSVVGGPGSGVYKLRDGASELVAQGDLAYGASIHQSEVWLSFDDTQFGTELWRYDGSNFSLGLDLKPGAEGSDPLVLGSLGDELVYAGINWNWQRLFKGEVLAGTVGAAKAHTLDGKIYYSGSLGQEGINGPQQLIRYNGVNRTALLEADVTYFGSHKQSLYFSGYDGYQSSDENTYRYHNGFSERIVSGNPGVDLGRSRNFIEFANKLYFQADTDEYGFEWWSLTPGPRLGRVYMELTPVWNNRYLWQLDLRISGAPVDLTYSIYKITDTGEIARAAQKRIYLDQHTAHSEFQKGNDGFTGKEQGIATLIVAFDSKTQRKLFSHVEVIGKNKSFDAEQVAKLEGEARLFGQRLTFKGPLKALKPSNRK